MEKIIVGLFISCVLYGCTQVTSSSPEFTNPEQKPVFNTLHKVYNWQVKNLGKLPLKNWQIATFQIGAISVYQATGYDKFLINTYEWAKNNNWEVGPRKFNADDQAVAQVYIDLYKEFNNDFMIEKYKKVAEAMVNEELHQDNEILWWWVDALFMAPPALVQLADVTQNVKYYTFMQKSWKETFNHLYSKDDSLFFRDRQFDNDYDSLGNKMFWLRGNGWAVAGLTRMLEELPGKEIEMDEVFKSVYIQTLKKLLSLQQTDGLWRSNLYYPNRFPEPETSGSALICYALAWGINNNVLNATRFEKAMLKSWEGLVRKVNNQGKMGYVQSVGYKPGKFDPDNAEVFGSGAFLLAASEVYKYFGDQ